MVCQFSISFWFLKVFLVTQITTIDLIILVYIPYFTVQISLYPSFFHLNVLSSSCLIINFNVPYQFIDLITIFYVLFQMGSTLFILSFWIPLISMYAVQVPINVTIKSSEAYNPFLHICVRQLIAGPRAEC